MPSYYFSLIFKTKVKVFTLNFEVFATLMYQVYLHWQGCIETLL